MPHKEDIQGFYDSLAENYDDMINFRANFEKNLEKFESFVKQHALSKVLDVGAGSGLHSLLLAKSGAEVTAVDISEEMLGRLKENARQSNLPIDVVKADFREIPQKVHSPFDGIVSLGNSMAHILKDEEIISILEGFHSMLNPGGLLFIQLLNYDRIMKNAERVQSVRKSGESTLIRFYDFCNEHLYFNLLKVWENENGMHHSLNTVELRPYLRDELSEFLKKSGFTELSFFGSLEWEAFDKETSPNLTVIAKRK